MDKKLFEKYTKTFGCRFTRSQKNKFLRAMHEDMEALGYTSQLIRGKKMISRAENYLFGNIKQVKTLVVVPYDTPEKKFWHKVLYFPMDGNKSASKTMAATYVPLLVVFAFVFIGAYVVQPLIKSTTINVLFSLLMFALTITLIYMMLHGFQNKRNVNRNSASLALIVELAQKLSKDERKKIGFLLTDKNKMRFLGAESSMNYFNENGKNPEIICLDCVGNGATTKIGYYPQNRKTATEIAKNYPVKKENIEIVKLSEDMRLQNAMSYYKKAVIISSGECDSEGNLYVLGTGTSKDTMVDETKLDMIEDMLYRYLHNSK